MKKRNHKDNKAKASSSEKAALASSEKKSESTGLSPSRRLIFGIIALVILPLSFLLLVELGLRVAGVGHDTGFFRKATFGGKEFLIDNESFSLRFFPPQLARWPGPVMFEAKKPANTYRIFILGESAARGEPEPNYASSRYLQAMLQDRFPGTHFEVINLGITAINSHVILPIARDCATADGDLWIIYMGNNEMVGPFGAATVFGAKAPPLPVVRLSLALQKTRIAQTLLDLLRNFKGKGENASWGGMKMFVGNQLSVDDPRREIVYRNFDKNLQDILRVGLDCGAKIILNNVAVNLADSPPFASLSPTNLPVTTKENFDKLFTGGNVAIESGDFKTALQAYGEAEKLNPQFAEVHYRLARCLLAQSNLSPARVEFQMACDLDALPFRTGRRINKIISEDGAKYAGTNLALVDTTIPFDLASPVGVSGAESFFEHVHFTFQGNYLLARTWAPEVEKFLKGRLQPKGSDWLSEAECEGRLGLSDWNRGGVIQSLLYRLHRPPLKDQFNNEERISALKKQVEEIGKRTDAPDARSRAKAMFEKAIQNAPDDHYLHENYADYFENLNDAAASSEEWRKVCTLLPEGCTGWYQLGRALAKQGKPREAIAPLKKALQIRPNVTEAWFELAQAQLALNQLDDALDSFKHAHENEPGDATYLAWMGKTLSQLKRHDEAGEQFKKAITIQPDLLDAYIAYGDELASINRFDGALEQYNMVTKNQPTNALAHMDAGVMLARLGKYDEAISEFNITLSLQPGNQQAREYLDRVAKWKINGR